MVSPLSPTDQAQQGVTPTWAPTFSRKAGGRCEAPNSAERAWGFPAILPFADFPEFWFPGKDLAKYYLTLITAK